MKLSLKQKAVLITTGMISSIMLGSLTVTFILQNVSAEIITNFVGAGLVAFLIWAFYGVVLSRLEYNETLKKLNEKVDK